MAKDERTTGDAAPQRPTGRRGRWALWVVPALPLAALVLAALFGPYLVLRIEPLRDRALDSQTVRRLLGDRLRVRVAAVDQFGLTGVELGGVSLQVRDSTGVWLPLGEIGRLSVRWSPLRQLSGETLVQACSAGPIVVRREALAILRAGAPAPRDGQVQAARALLPAGLPRVAVRQLQLGPIEVHEAERVVLRAGLEHAELTADADGVEFLPRDLWAELPERSLELRIAEAAIRVTGEQAEVQQLVFGGATAAGSLKGRYEPGAKGGPLQGELVLERLDPAAVTRWLSPGVLPRPGDTARGLLKFQLGAQPAMVRFDLEGTLLGEGCSQCAGVVRFDSGAIDFEQVRLLAEACDLEASGRWDGAARRVTLSGSWSRFDPSSAWLPWLHELPLGGSFPCSFDMTIDVPAGQAPVLAGQIEARDARPLGVHVDRLRFAGQVVPGEAVTAEELVIESRGGRLSAAGRYPLAPAGADVEGWVEADSVPIGALPVAWRRGAEGRVWGAFTVSGVASDPQLEGSLRGAGLRVDAWSARELAVGSLLIWPRDLRGSGTVTLRDLRSGPGAPADLEASFARWQEWISLTADLRHPAAEVHLEGRVDPAGRLELEGGSAAVRRFGHWELDAPCAATWADGTVSVDSLRLSSNGTRLVAAGRWAAARQELALGARLEGFGLERLREMLASPALELHGRCDLRLDAAGRLPDPRVQLEVRAESLATAGLDLGRIDLALGWADGALGVENGRVTSRALRAEIALLRAQTGTTLTEFLGLATPGEANARPAGPGGAGSHPDLLERLRRTEWEGRVEIERLDLASWGPLLGMPSAAAGDSGQGRAVVRTVGGRPVPIRVNNPWETSSADAGTGGVGGGLHGTLQLGGSLVEPRLHLTAQAADLSWGGAAVGALAIEAGYENSRLQVPKLSLTQGEHVSRVSGHYPLHVELLPFRSARTDGPADVQVVVTDLNVGLVSGLIPWLTDVHGALHGTLALGGTGLHPELAGSLYLRRGGFRIPGRSERIFDVEADMQLTSEGLRVVSLSGRTGPKGTMRAAGLVKHPDEFDLLASAEQVRVFEQGVYSFDATAESLRVFSRRGEETPPVPRIRGHVTVLNGYLRPRLEPVEDGASPAHGPPIPWEIDIDVAIPGTVQVSQASSRADAGEGELRLSFRWPYWKVSGSLRVLGGTYRLLNNNFEILGGTVEVRDTGTLPEVEVDVTGETYVVVNDEQSESRPVRVEVHVSGHPEELQIDLSSDPSYTPEQIAELLTYRRLTGTGRLGAETEGVLINESVARLEAALAEQIPPSTTVSIESSSESGEAWRPRRVRLQQMITPELTGDYTQEFYQGTDWEFYVHYRLSRLFSLRMGMSRERDETHGFSEEYSADLRWWFEYE